MSSSTKLSAFETVSRAADHGSVMLTHGDDCYEGDVVVIGDSALRNFGGCSYLGLDQHPALKHGAIRATESYGTQFSFSRAFLECPLYVELEALLDQMTDRHVLVTPTTTLGHLSALPVIIEHGYAILDRHVHASVQTAMRSVRTDGFDYSSSMAELADLLEHGCKRRERVWYLFDGVYSMSGAVAPFDELNALMRRFPNLWAYCDDAHSTSWAGQHGRGLALERIEDKSRLVVALSLNKAFSAAGGAIVFPTAEMKRQVRYSGGPMIFSGPVQPPMLGAGIASAKVHLSAELEHLQDELATRIAHVEECAQAHGLDLAAYGTPISFLQIGELDATLRVARRLRDRGFYASPGMYPAVARDRAGIRFTVSTVQSLDDVSKFVAALAESVREV